MKLFIYNIINLKYNLMNKKILKIYLNQKYYNKK